MEEVMEEEMKEDIIKNAINEIKISEVFLIRFSFNELQEAVEILNDENIKVIEVKNLETNTILTNEKERFFQIIRQMRRGRFEVRYEKSC